MCTKRVLFLATITCVGALIVPEELPSLLSVAYSNIPPIKKGTDSRIGFGFSLGNHADFQVLFEIGPQSNTNPIGTNYPSTSKRQVVNKVQKVHKATQQTSKIKSSQGSDYLSSWSQGMKTKKQPKPFVPLPIPGQPQLPPMNLEQALAAAGVGPLPGTTDLRQLVTMQAGGEIRQPAAIAMKPLKQLQQLYGENPAGSQETTQDVPVEDLRDGFQQATGGFDVQRLAQFHLEDDSRRRKITAELSDVDLDDE